MSRFSRDFRFDRRNQETHRINPPVAQVLGASFVGESPRHIMLPLEPAELDVVPRHLGQLRYEHDAAVGRTSLEEWVPLRFRSSALIAIGFGAEKGNRQESTVFGPKPTEPRVRIHPAPPSSPSVLVLTGESPE